MNGVRAMSGKSIRDIKLQGFSAIAAIVVSTLVLIGGWLFLGRLSLNARLTPDVSPNPPQNLSQSPPDSSSPNSSGLKSELIQDSTSENQENPSASSVRQGLLRIANSSEHPVRVALLLKKSGQSKQVRSAAENYEPPAHWDFAPGEGQTKGLLLSLPNRSLKVKQGDVLVAFAQDGSRRYWGPYVVGETAIPNWSSKSGEWQLVLAP